MILKIFLLQVVLPLVLLNKLRLQNNCQTNLFWFLDQKGNVLEADDVDQMGVNSLSRHEDHSVSTTPLNQSRGGSGGSNPSNSPPESTERNTRSEDHTNQSRSSQSMSRNSDIDVPKKRPRTAFTPEQIKRLEGEFAKNKYLSVAKRMELSKALNLTETQVNLPNLKFKIFQTENFESRDIYFLCLISR